MSSHPQKPPYVYAVTNDTKTDESKIYEWAKLGGVYYTGFCIDLLEMIRIARKFKLQLQKVPTMGSKKDNKTWEPETSTMGILTNKKVRVLLLIHCCEDICKDLIFIFMAKLSIKYLKVDII